MRIKQACAMRIEQACAMRMEQACAMRMKQACAMRMSGGGKQAANYALINTNLLLILLIYPRK